MKILSRYTGLGAFMSVAVVGCGQRGTAEQQSQLKYLDKNSFAQNRVVEHAVSGTGETEICVLPDEYAGGDYDNGDRKDAAQLCQMNFYANSKEEGGVNVCAKIRSTNPGLEIHSLKTKDGSVISKSRFETTECRKPRKRNAKKLAKFKQSITCSYTGSILSSYHISRLLGGVAKVPVAVIRTMDLDKHQVFLERGLRDSQGYIINSWKNLDAALHGGGRTNRTYEPLLLTTDKKQIFGALSDNPRGEIKHPLVNVKPYSRFAAKKHVKLVMNSNSVRSLVGTTLENGIYDIYVMKDIADMIVFDTIMGQQDRLGNIHAWEYYYFMQDGELKKKRAKKVDDPSSLPQPAIKVPRLMLKDSDCGIRNGGNLFLKERTYQKLRHLNLETYARVRWMAQEWEMGLRDFLYKEGTFDTPNRWGNNIDNVIGKNLRTVAQTLEANCKSGKLLLDLSAKKHLAGTNYSSAARSQCGAIYNASTGEIDNVEPVTPRPGAQLFPKYCKVTADTLNTRTSPAARGISNLYYISSGIHALNQGASLKATEEKGNWYAVEFRLFGKDHGKGEGKVYVHKDYLTCNR